MKMQVHSIKAELSIRYLTRKGSAKRRRKVKNGVYHRLLGLTVFAKILIYKIIALKLQKCCWANLKKD
jgi:hypothetical protein